VDWRGEEAPPASHHGDGKGEMKGRPLNSQLRLDKKKGEKGKENRSSRRRASVEKKEERGERGKITKTP